ncbi:MAG: MFS transporter, partial [Ktedonobacteraceae bacterium]|nr:MFS transporter [Ktedonobacteraceae bacterium]
MAAVNRGEGFLTLLKKRNFLYIWLAQLISMTVFNASNYALLILIESATHSTTLVGLAIISFSIPAVLFGAPAGVFVDHMNKRRVLWASNCLRALASFLFVGVLFISHKLLVPVYLLTFLISAISQFFAPAEGSAIPMLVSEDELMPALSLFNITFMLSQALGFILFAPLALSLLPTFHIATTTIDPMIQLYALVSIFYLVCALLIILIPHSSFIQKKQMQAKTGPLTTETLDIFHDVWNEMYQGWSFVRRSKALFLGVIQLSFAGILLLVISQLASPMVTQLLGLPANAMAFIFAPAGIGLVVGSVLMPHITRHTGKERAIFIGTIMLTVATALLPLITKLAHALQPHSWNGPPLLILAALIMCAAGFAIDFINLPALTTVQELTPDWIKGRVLALQLVLYNACAIPIILFIGVFADVFGISRVLYLLAICEIAFGVWGIYYRRKHRQRLKGSPEVKDEQEEP